MLIDYSAGPRVTAVGDHVVYTKSSWAAPWTAQPNLVCTECQWQAAPEFSSAVLVWRTGYIIPPGSTSATLYGPWIGRGHFVRIDWTCDDGSTLIWTGFIDQSAWPTDAWGDQPLVCYGLERALALTPIVDRVVKRGSTYPRSAVPPTFGFGNRSKDPDPGGVYAFFDGMRDDWKDSRTWSTRAIVRYLLKYNCPTNNFGVGAIPWSIDQEAQLPDWDSPQIECQGKTVWDVLNELVNPQKQMGMVFGSNGTTAVLRVFTHTATNIVNGSHILPANPNQHVLVLSPDALTSGSLSDVGGGYDQVICRGARRQTICTLSHGTEIEKDWTDQQEEQYEQAASTDAGYDTANTQTQRQMNARVRAKSYLEAVFRRFRIVKTFNYNLAGEPLFPGNTNPLRVEIVDRLPIDADAEWFGAIDQSDYDDQGQAWKFYFANPDDLLKYVDLSYLDRVSAETVSTGDQPTISVVPKNEYGSEFTLNVSGGPQHAIAGTNFVRLPVDAREKCWGNLDYTTMKVTLALEEDRFCEGRFPSSAPAVDVVRRLYVDCGPEYRQIRIHKDTIASLDPQGTDQKVTASGFLRDDSSKLSAIAQIIAMGAVLTRKRVAWTSQRRISTVQVGDIILTAEGATVLAPVTSVRISAPTSTNTPSACPTQSFETFGGTQDPLAVLRRLGMVI